MRKLVPSVPSVPSVPLIYSVPPLILGNDSNIYICARQRLPFSFFLNIYVYLYIQLYEIKKKAFFSQYICIFIYTII